MTTDLQQEFWDITICPICIEKLSDTRTLPCVHTFCRKCLVKVCCKSSGMIKCPCCRNEYEIPIGGIQEFPKNHFIEKLLRIKRKSLKLDQIRETTLICSFEGHKDKKDFAYYFCVECEHHMCRWCSESHSKQSHSHQILSTGCLNHREKHLEFFCRTCKLPICSECLSVTHKFHKVCTFTDYATTSEKELDTVKSIKSREIRSLQAKIYNVELEKVEIKALKKEIKALKKGMPDVLVLERNYKYEKLEKEVALKKVNEKASELEEQTVKYKRALEEHNKTLAEMRQRISKAEILRLKTEAIQMEKLAKIVRDDVVVKLTKRIGDLQQQSFPFVHPKGESCSRNTNGCNTVIRSVHDLMLLCKICRQELCLSCFSKSLTDKITENRTIEDRENNNRGRIVENKMPFNVILIVCSVLIAVVAYLLGRFST